MVMKKLKRILAGVMAGVLIGTCSIPGTARAEGGDTQSAVQEETSNTEDKEASEEVTNENKVEEKTEGIEKEEQTVSPEENNVSVEQGIVEESENEGEVSESLLNYLYVESPYLETPAEENLVVSWGDGTEAVEKMEIIYLHNEQESSFELENKGEGLYLYQKEFTEEESGVYELTNLKITEAGQEFTYDLAEVGIQACFGVNEYYPGYEPEVTEETAGSDEGVAVVTEEDVESSEAEAIVGDALAAVGAEANGVAQISAYALNDNARTSNGQIVVALDAGHCDLHAGASGNGVKEEEATLKIAQYCKEELEQYAGVKVYMCRTSAACPYPEVNVEIAESDRRPLEDIRRRVRASVAQGADIYVSIHLNSIESQYSSANGAEVWYPDSKPKVNENPQTVAQMSASGKMLAEKIQSELVSLGLYNRGAKETDDNFACMDEGVKHGLPAIIVEHAFLSNAGDANKYLKTEAGLKSLGVADATGIAKYFGLSIGKWIQEDGKWKYQLADGSFITSSWKKIGSEWYYFGSDAYMHTGWLNQNGVKYYLDNSGAMRTGWLYLDDKWYYLGSDGAMQIGWQAINGYWYYMDDSGVMQTGWQYIGGQTYYFHSAGRMLTGWQTIDGETYYFHSAGRMLTGWQTIGGKTYYFQKSGAMVTGTATIDGKKYQFGSDGVCLGEVKSKGWNKEGEYWYYIKSDGSNAIGWEVIGGYYYYFAVDGKMQTGWQYIGGQTYYFHSAGRMLTGWQFIDNVWYYFHNAGRMLTGWQMIGGTWCYFEKNGVYKQSGVTCIEGKSQKTKSQMIAFYQASGFTYPAKALGNGGAESIEKFVDIYIEEAEMEGIRADVAFVQAMLETKYLQFGGDVKIEQFNFAGLGATGGGVPGNVFPDVRTGVRAQIQHLKAYATSKSLNQECVDTRYQYVNKGSAPYVEWLGIQENPNKCGWAAGKDYGFHIVAMLNKM